MGAFDVWKVDFWKITKCIKITNFCRKLFQCQLFPHIFGNQNSVHFIHYLGSLPTTKTLFFSGVFGQTGFDQNITGTLWENFRKLQECHRKLDKGEVVVVVEEEEEEKKGKSSFLRAISWNETFWKDGEERERDHRIFVFTFIYFLCTFFGSLCSVS